jgi:hypothetical protein
MRNSKAANDKLKFAISLLLPHTDVLDQLEIFADLVRNVLDSSCDEVLRREERQWFDELLDKPPMRAR